MKFHLSLDGVVDYIRSNEEQLQINGNKYISFVKSNPEALNMFRRIKKDLRLVQNDIITRANNNYDNNINNIQFGGDPTTAILLGSLSGALVVSAIASILYFWFNRFVCKDEYPLVTVNVSAIDLMMKLVPNDWIEVLPNMRPSEFFRKFNAKLDYLVKPLQFLNRDTMGQKIAVNAGRIIASAGLVTATAGAGGDEALNFLFDFKDILDVLAAISESIEKMAGDTAALRFLFNIFNINFEDGPYGVECWMNYIIKNGSSSALVYYEVCKLFNKLLDKFAIMIGDLIATLLPNTMGIPSIVISTMIQKARDGAVSAIISRLNDNYFDISYDTQLMIQNPKELKVYLDEKLDLFINIFSLPQKTVGKLIPIPYLTAGPDAVVYALRFMRQYTAFFAVGIHRMFALTYSLLFILEKCTDPEFSKFIHEQAKIEYELKMKYNQQKQYQKQKQIAREKYIQQMKIQNEMHEMEETRNEKAKEISSDIALIQERLRDELEDLNSES